MNDKHTIDFRDYVQTVDGLPAVENVAHYSIGSNTGKWNIGVDAVLDPQAVKDALDKLPSGDQKSCFSSHLGVWLMEPSILRQRAEEVKLRLAMERPIDASVKAEAKVLAPAWQSGKSVAVVEIHGAITKRRSKFAETSALEVRHLVRQLANDDKISRIVLHIDSPGGSVAGVDDLAAEVREAAKKKPVIAYCEDLCASAGYWIASQATEIVANRGAFIGSLGVYAVIQDTSGKMEREGVKVHVISTGGVKGAGVSGAPLTDAHLQAEQKIVDSIGQLFKANVKGGRNLTWDAVDNLFDGAVHVAEKALSLGLIDRIGSLESTFAEFPKKEEEKKEDPKDSEEEDEESDEEDKKKKPAPFGDLKEKENAMTLNEAELVADVKVRANEIKEAGCPYSIESITSKLLAAGKTAPDNLSALEKLEEVAAKLSAVKKFVGKTAPMESVKTESAKLPGAQYADLASIKAEWKEKYNANLKTFRDNDAMRMAKALTKTRDENPELHQKMIEGETAEWENRIKV